MPDLKLARLFESVRPAELEPALRPFLGRDEDPAIVESTRLQPSVAYWAVYRRGSRRAILKAFFSESVFRTYAELLADYYPSRLSKPRHPSGGIAVLPEINGVLWGFPFDPALPDLHRCLDTKWIDAVLPGRRRSSLHWELLSYSPEISALFVYRGARRRVAFGKVAGEDTEELVYRVMDWLWSSPVRDVVGLARPLALRPAAGLLLQAPVGGRIIGRERNRVGFLDLSRQAARALGAIHGSGIPFGPERRLQHVLRQLEDGLNDVSLVAPFLYDGLRRLVTQIRARVGQTPIQVVVPSHGDFKYDQFLIRGGRFSLIDFEFFCQAERALDVGNFCAYLPPSSPRDWRDSAAVEILRGEFLRSYEEAAGVSLDFERVGLYESGALALRALVHLWGQQPGWQLTTSELMDLALHRLVDPEPAAAATYGAGFPTRKRPQ